MSSQKKGTYQPAPAWEEPDTAGAGDGELLWNAVEEAMTPIMKMEKEWDENKLQKKVREYFNKGAKNISFRNKDLWSLINEYADNVFSSLFCGLGDREWLLEGHADFILVLDAGIKEHFPKPTMRGVAQHQFEQMVLAANDRAFEEQRFALLLQEAVSCVQGAKTKRRVWNAVEAGRKEAASTASLLDDFMVCWIDRCVHEISQGSQGDPESVLTADTAAVLFRSLVEGGALPLSMTQEAGPPPSDWPLIDDAIQTAYITHTAFDDGSGADAKAYEEPPAKKRKGAGKGGRPFSAF